MADDSQLIAELADKQAITETLYRYCRGLDRMDRAMADTVWHPDGTADYGPSLPPRTGAEFLDFVFDYHAGLDAHAHTVTNTLIELDSPAGTAGSETYVAVWLQTKPADGTVTEIHHRGRYIDRWSRRDGRWGIDHRIFVGDIYQEDTHPAPDPRAPWGRRDREDASYTVFP